MHGVGKYEGMVKRTIGGIERDYLLVAYKGGDKLYVPSDQIDTLRQYVGGEAPKPCTGSVVQRLRQGEGTGQLSAVREIAQELVVLLPEAGQCRDRLRVRPGHALAEREMEEAFPYVETPGSDARRSTTSNRDMEQRTTRWTV